MIFSCLIYGVQLDFFPNDYIYLVTLVFCEGFFVEKILKFHNKYRFVGKNQAVPLSSQNNS